MRFGWLIPAKGRRLAMLIRLAVVAVLLFVFRYHVMAFLLLCHNFVWQEWNDTGDNNGSDVETLLRLGTPGARAIFWMDAGYAFANAPDPAVLPYLQRIATDKSRKPKDRMHALQGMAMFMDSKSLDIARAVSDDPDSRVRFAAVQIFCELGTEKDLPFLREQVKKEPLPYVRIHIERAIDLITPKPWNPNAPRVRVAAIQMISEFANPDLNRKRACEFVRRAARGGAKIIVLPETAIQGYLSTDLKKTWRVGNRPVQPQLRGVSPEKYAERVPGPSTDCFTSLAKELGVYVTIPLLEKSSAAGIYFNTLCLAAPDGRIALTYRKRNPWNFAESGWATAGDKPVQRIDTEYGRLGLLICYDINFEPPRLKEERVDILLYSIAWVENAKSNWFPIRLPRIARDYNVSIIGANWAVPREQAWHGYGQSSIIHRSGRILASAKSDIGEEIVYADIPVEPRPVIER